MTDLVDSSLPSICHNRPLPCSSQNTTFSSISSSSSLSNSNSNSKSEKDAKLNAKISTKKNENSESRTRTRTRKLINKKKNRNIRGTDYSIENLSASSSCLSKSLLSKLMKDADRLFCNKYTGNHGGEIATKLSTYPFLKEVSCYSIYL